MVVDCGGGTVDITVHEMETERGHLKELYKATGGPFGSTGKSFTIICFLSTAQLVICGAFVPSVLVWWNMQIWAFVVVLDKACVLSLRAIDKASHQS